MTSPAYEAALEYIEGRNARREAAKISNAKIATKFECSEQTVGNVCRGVKTRVPEEDQKLILALKAEQQRLQRIHSERLLPTLAHRKGVTQADIKLELSKLGVTVQ